MKTYRAASHVALLLVMAVPAVIASGCTPTVLVRTAQRQRLNESGSPRFGTKMVAWRVVFVSSADMEESRSILVLSRHDGSEVQHVGTAYSDERPRERDAGSIFGDVGSVSGNHGSVIGDRGPVI